MLMPSKPSLDPKRRTLLDTFSKLDREGQEQILAFAEFLLQRKKPQPPEPAVDQTPRDIPRPEEETVVAAIRRLSATYHMLDKQALLHETSSLMSAHVLQGRPAADVIDELERLFEAGFLAHNERFRG